MGFPMLQISKFGLGILTQLTGLPHRSHSVLFLLGDLLYWSGGMSPELVGFAGDGMGNLFCFRRLGTAADRPDDAPVWLFDHEFPDRDVQIALSFDDWLTSFLALRPKVNP